MKKFQIFLLAVIITITAMAFLFLLIWLILSFIFDEGIPRSFLTQKTIGYVAIISCLVGLFANLIVFLYDADCFKLFLRWYRVISFLTFIVAIVFYVPIYPAILKEQYCSVPFPELDILGVLIFIFVGISILHRFIFEIVSALRQAKKRWNNAIHEPE